MRTLFETPARKWFTFTKQPKAMAGYDFAVSMTNEWAKRQRELECERDIFRSNVHRWEQLLAGELEQDRERAAADRMLHHGGTVTLRMRIDGWRRRIGQRIVVLGEWVGGRDGI